MGPEVFEGIMLFAFSISWYWSIAKMLKVRAAAGKSPLFVVLIVSGYLFGIMSKVIIWQNTGEMSPLLYLYVWNLIVTFTDLLLVLHFSRQREPAPAMA